MIVLRTGKSSHKVAANARFVLPAKMLKQAAGTMAEVARLQRAVKLKMPEYHAIAFF